MVYLNALGMICSLGKTCDEITRGLLDLAQSGVVMTETYSPGHPLPLGRIDAALPSVDELPLRDRSRNNQLTLAALTQIRPAVDDAIERYGAERIGIVIGTSAAGTISLWPAGIRLPCGYAGRQAWHRRPSLCSFECLRVQRESAGQWGSL